MDKLINSLVGLLQIKKLIAIGFVIVFLIRTLQGAIDVPTFMSVFTIIIGMYFGQSIAKDNQK